MRWPILSRAYATRRKWTRPRRNWKKDARRSVSVSASWIWRWNLRIATNRLYRESGFLLEICGENRDVRTITGDLSMTKRGRSLTIWEIRLGLGETRTQSPGRGWSRPIPGALGAAFQARH